MVVCSSSRMTIDTIFRLTMFPIQTPKQDPSMSPSCISNTGVQVQVHTTRHSSHLEDKRTCTAQHTAASAAICSSWSLVLCLEYPAWPRLHAALQYDPSLLPFSLPATIATQWHDAGPHPWPFLVTISPIVFLWFSMLIIWSIVCHALLWCVCLFDSASRRCSPFSAISLLFTNSILLQYHDVLSLLFQS